MYEWYFSKESISASYVFMATDSINSRRAGDKENILEITNLTPHTSMSKGQLFLPWPIDPRNIWRVLCANNMYIWSNL